MSRAAFTESSIEGHQQCQPESCKNCGRISDWRLRGDFNNEVSECKECGGLTFRGALDVAITDLYDRSYFHGAEYSDYSTYEWAHSINFKSKISAIVKARGDNRGWRVLELGAATGEFYRALQRFPGLELSNYIGVEVSDYARSIANQRGIDVVSPFEVDYLKRVADLSPNLIVAWDVWEHLDRPADIFKGLFEYASSSLTVALSTVDYSALVAQKRGRRWRQYHPPTHLNYPTRASFKRYFEDLGFDIRAHRSEGVYRPCVEYLNCVLPKGVVQFLKPLHRVPLYLNTFDTQLVIASRGGGSDEG
jgi:hypothetical protein